ncbi:tetrapyrrole biosynthesis, uroporphyrinogen III synthase [Lindgomyces ingoldianus]|uniref:Tetrapyrrole biosynthesis, uroporphyrinogen III synthase n=1 Tax=Lindgomyces ingoldianus TaxID=673940 RepID=A0ACB6RES3_9PLEO|nr:tetrapyrrole biosynthesis, uroporphyrinogen III synthase [Lindgomyces ingoldianus]KAF2477844.1 tetrapyrrole biosynthesis, uroporphyrinogen III synthase [Lindgomyces ingoldianus]
MADATRGKIPILLLKTKSAPTDAYEEFFSSFDDGRYKPVFVPVLAHRFQQDALDQVRNYITGQGFVPGVDGGLQKYGALIFTSQRAVEAFTQVVEDIRSVSSYSLDELLPESIPLYAVGPATARGLRALKLPCPILGEETGNGDALSSFILEHYNSLHLGSTKPAILFLVGDKRRDIIPKTLQSDSLPPERRSEVDELVTYDTGEMQSFKSDFSALWAKNRDSGAGRQWVVVFSPTGCRAMLESLDLLDRETGQAKTDTAPRDILIATIGPTTRDYLNREFAFLPDVCAETPTPEGVGNGIEMRRRQLEQRESPRTLRRQIRKAEEKLSERSKRPLKRTITGDEGKHVTASVEMTEDSVNSKDPGEEDSEYVTDGGVSETEVQNEGIDNPEKPSNEASKGGANGNGVVEETSSREKKTASNIIEKEFIYFFTLNRVGIEQAQSVGNLQRTYFVLRPLPAGVKLGDGALPDLKNNRLFALPKKVLPRSRSDQFMAFVKKAKTTIQGLKGIFFPRLRGVYDLKRTEYRTIHLVYATIIPSKLGEVQQDLDVRARGSFIISKAVEPTMKDKKHQKETPTEEIEQLKHEDGLRTQNLHGDDSVFDNLQINKKDYPQVPTTW